MHREDLKDRDRTSEVETHLLICVSSLVASKGLLPCDASLNLFIWFLFLLSYKKFQVGQLEISQHGMGGSGEVPRCFRGAPSDRSFESHYQTSSSAWS